ncbi:aminodeoxychorismate synthase component I [Kushneria aurantia]|uniref:aminodeoxychorismate synthase n=1 Tax=Kushneria aurantia TaxID=504092 RepID=A0ABV6G8G7_9GAMM|nr:aminodeoxychorismate synthase component I [Kushneria aurantia]
MSDPQLLVYDLPWQETPTRYFSALRHRPGAVLLDSGRPGNGTGRFDILSSDPLATLTVEHNGQCRASTPLEATTPLAAQRELLSQLNTLAPEEDSLPFVGGLIGYWSYDFGRLLEHLSDSASADIDMPLVRLGLYDWALIQDHEQQRSVLVATAERRNEVLEWLAAEIAPVSSFRLITPFTADIDRSEYGRLYRRVSHYLHSGDCYQVNLAQRFQARCEGDSWSAWQRLREATPAPFSAWLSWQGEDGGERTLLSLSPESFLALSNRRLITRPIKGTRPRGATAATDRQLADELRNSRKDLAENVMIVDLLRNDLGRVCRPGSVQVPGLAELESYRNVHHLVSTVEGELSADFDAFDALAAAFPGGSITGAPRIRAMDIIDELEATRRGPWCGSIGYIDLRGGMSTSITIRTLVRENDRLCIWGGGGIVADSDEQSEYDESIAKIRHLMNALG